MRIFHRTRAALVSSGVLLSLAGPVPAHAALGDEITCTGQLTSWHRDAFNDWTGNGSATCVIVDNDAPSGTAVRTVAIYGTSSVCVGASYGFQFNAGGHLYYLAYLGASTLGSGVEPGVLTLAQKDSALYSLLALDPMAGAAVVADARVSTGVCAGYVEPRPTVAFTFNAVLPSV